MNAAKDSVLIVGGGIIGIACAHYLNRSGYKVTVIDKDKIGKACSYGNLGFVCPSHILPLTEPGAIADGMKSLFTPRSAFRVKPQLRWSLFAWMLQFARRCTHTHMLQGGAQLQVILDSSIDEFRRLLADTELRPEWQESGLLFVFHTDKGMAQFAETDRLLTSEFGVSAKRYSGAELRQFEPAISNGLPGGFFYDDDASLRPEILNDQWCRLLQHDGVEFIEDCQLLEIEKESGRVSGITTSMGTLIADHFVFATGAWSVLLDSALECNIPVEAGKGYSVTVAKPDRCPRRPILFPEHRVGVAPFESGFRLGSMMEFAGFDTSIPDFRIRQLLDSTAPYLGAIGDVEIQDTWYGWRPMTWDSLPIIGRVPKLSNALLATGHNMLGVSLAPATGRLIAELVDERPTHIDASAFSPERFQ